MTAPDVQPADPSGGGPARADLPDRLRSVLMATDLAPSSRHVAERAVRVVIANGASGARLSLMHVVNGSALDGLQRLVGVEANIEQGLLGAARLELHALATELGQRSGAGPKLSITESVATGAITSEIVSAAEVAAADLVVVGAHSANWLTHRLLGSTTARLLQRLQRPLLVVRSDASEPYETVLVAVDFSAWTSASIRLSRQVAPAAHLVLLHAWELPFESMLRRAGIEPDRIQQYQREAEAEVSRHLERLAEDHGLAAGSYTPVAAHGHARSSILEQAAMRRCDLVVVGQHGRHFTEALLLVLLC